MLRLTGAVVLLAGVVFSDDGGEAIEVGVLTGAAGMADFVTDGLAGGFGPNLSSSC